MNHIISTADVVRRSQANGGHFFDADTMRFFRSRVSAVAEWGAMGRMFFVTSERRTGFRYEDGPRTYCVRVMDWETGNIAEATPFSEKTGYRTKRAAEKARAAYAAQDRAGAAWPCADECADAYRSRGHTDWSEMWHTWRQEHVGREQARVDELRAAVEK